MADNNLTVDLVGPTTKWCFNFEHVENKPISFDYWHFGKVFGELEDSILSVFSDALDREFREEPPFALHVPQVNFYHKEPASPLDIFIQFGFDEDRDQHYYTHSIDKIVAIELEWHREKWHSETLSPDTDESYKYSMDAKGLARFKKFSAALKELADKIDTELAKVVIKEE